MAGIPGEPRSEEIRKKISEGMRAVMAERRRAKEGGDLPAAEAPNGNGNGHGTGSTAHRDIVILLEAREKELRVELNRITIAREVLSEVLT